MLWACMGGWGASPLKPVSCYLHCVVDSTTNHDNLLAAHLLLYRLLCLLILTFALRYPQLPDVAQYHTWLLSKFPNSQPIYLLSLLPGYPLLNFSVVTALYIFLSHRLFVLTAALRDAMIPHDDNVALRRNLLALGGVSGAAWGIGYLLLMAVGG
jgi:hypothetical protein